MKIGVLTSGGDAPGMNAAVRAVVRSAIVDGMEVVGIKRGFAGIFDEDFVTMDSRSVAGILTLGGTKLHTARCMEFYEEEYQKKAADILRKHGIEGLVVIGGDGSFCGAAALSRLGIKVVGVPATIDMDIACTDYTIGFDTAINTAMDAIDKIRDSSAAHERCAIIEVMGRHAGYIALYSAIATGAEDVLLPENNGYDEEEIINRILENRSKGKSLHMIINAEGVGDSVALAGRIEAKTGIETRATLLGHMQRGGHPTCKDRVYASMMGVKAALLLKEGKTNRVVAYRGGEYVDLDINEALAMSKELSKDMLETSRRLIR